MSVYAVRPLKSNHLVLASRYTRPAAVPIYILEMSGNQFSFSFPPIKIPVRSLPFPFPLPSVFQLFPFIIQRLFPFPPTSIPVHQLRNSNVMWCNLTIINYAQLHMHNMHIVLRSADTIYQSYFYFLIYAIKLHSIFSSSCFNVRL